MILAEYWDTKVQIRDVQRDTIANKSRKEGGGEFRECELFKHYSGEAR
jgi:hypothetical protein